MNFYFNCDSLKEMAVGNQVQPNIQCLSRSPWLVSHPLLLFHLSSGKLEGHHHVLLNKKTTETVANVKDKIETTENGF